MGKLDDKIAIVTGAGRGIGRAIAEKLAGEGATVVSDVDESTAAQTAEAIGGVAVPADVTERGSVTAMVEQAHRRFGRIDVLVNNAGWDKAGPRAPRPGRSRSAGSPSPPASRASSRSSLPTRPPSPGRPSAPAAA